ncbi:hypothetical protein FF38_00210 [Lucilia cuprina]|uniref:Uncharacterized protein n=1 Tax=Lucilia cuprina TaxID=7375 RepID=A0A0L0CCP8_LUCCU|nr:hypothetical protein FF38_00210 [Lucilia cuprina]
MKCIRVLSYVLRGRYKHFKIGETISPDEIRNTLYHMVIQGHYFSNCIKELQQQDTLKGTLSSLKPFIDEVE